MARSRHIIFVERGRSGDSFLGMEIIRDLGAESEAEYGRHCVVVGEVCANQTWLNSEHSTNLPGGAAS